MFCAAINGSKALNTLHYENSFTEHIAMLQSNEDVRI